MDKSISMSTVILKDETKIASERAFEMLRDLIPFLKTLNLPQDFDKEIMKKLDHFFEHEETDIAFSKLYYECDFKILYLNMAVVNINGVVNPLRNIFAWKLS